MPEDLNLEKLKEKDPATWEAIAKGIPLKPCGQYLTYDNGEIRSVQYQAAFIPFSELLPDVALNHLAGCLQRACESRGWETEQNYRIKGRDGDLPKELRYYAVITTWERNVKTYRGSGDSPAFALLSAYLAVIEVT